MKCFQVLRPNIELKQAMKRKSEAAVARHLMYFEAVQSYFSGQFTIDEKRGKLELNSGISIVTRLNLSPVQTSKSEFVIIPI